jgi:hypothetical protein
MGNGRFDGENYQPNTPLTAGPSRPRRDRLWRFHCGTGASDRVALTGRIGSEIGVKEFFLAVHITHFGKCFVVIVTAAVGVKEMCKV